MSTRLGALLVVTGLALALGSLFVVAGLLVAVCGGMVSAIGMESALAREGLEPAASADPTAIDATSPD
jgi:hypothetical protein